MLASLENIEVFYEIEGEGRPIVMLHGFTTDHRQMMGCMEPLMKERDGWRRIYLDFPGMGQTPAKDWINNSDHMLDVVCEFIDHLIPDTHFVLAGYSYGGYMARGVLHRKVELVDGVLLICPMIYEPGKRQLPPKNIVVKDPELMAKLSQEEKETFEQWVTVQSERVWARTKDEINVGVEMGDEDFQTRLQETGYPFSFLPESGIGHFVKPTLILTGRQDWVVGYRDSWNILESYPRATFAVLDRAGHNLAIVQEKAFNAYVNEWLDRIEESLG